MRGPLYPPSFSSFPVRIIPAYAGTTVINKQMGVVIKDHPRLCGDHILCPFCDF